MILVSEAKNKIRKEYGDKIASEFYRLMVEWDGGPNTRNAFYGQSVIDMMLTHARENLNGEE